jgi:type III secretory pathway component EscV
VRITTAAAGRRADIAARQRRYLMSMAVRTMCFVAAVAVGPGWPRWVFVAAAVLLPYVAVVMANASASKSDGFALTDGTPQQPQLPRGTGSEELGNSDNS